MPGFHAPRACPVDIEDRLSERQKTYYRTFVDVAMEAYGGREWADAAPLLENAWQRSGGGVRWRDVEPLLRTQWMQRTAPTEGVEDDPAAAHPGPLHRFLESVAARSASPECADAAIRPDRRE